MNAIASVDKRQGKPTEAQRGQRDERSDQPRHRRADQQRNDEGLPWAMK